MLLSCGRANHLEGKFHFCCLKDCYSSQCHSREIRNRLNVVSMSVPSKSSITLSRKLYHSTDSPLFIVSKLKPQECKNLGKSIWNLKNLTFYIRSTTHKWIHWYWFTLSPEIVAKAYQSFYLKVIFRVEKISWDWKL